MTTATKVRLFKRLRKEQIVTAEARLARLRKIDNLTFLRYEDYCALSRDSHGYGREWGYVTRADGDVSYGDLKEDDCPDSAESYLRALCTDDTDSGEVYFYVPCASGSDYSGCTVTRSNYLVFQETYGSEDWVFSAHGGYSTYAAVVGLTGLLTCADDTADSILDALDGLENYPLLDEEALSTLEMELADEAWDSWVADDFVKALETKFDGLAEFELPSGSALRTFFEEKREESNAEWYCEGMGHDMWVDIGRVVKGIDLDDLDEYAIRYVVSYVDVGETREECATESDAIARVATLRAAGFIGATYTVETPVKEG
jgi:hypothetical protein